MIECIAFQIFQKKFVVLRGNPLLRHMTQAEGSDYSFFTSSYRHDVSGWSGKSYRKPENISRELDLSSAAASSSTVTRCMKSMKSGCRPICTPTSTQRAAYGAPAPFTRATTATYTMRIPNVPAPPDAPNMTLFRPTTEYGSRYTPPRSEPFIKQETINRCQTAAAATRASSAATRGYNPTWNTSYRAGHCERAANARYSQAVTFHSNTNLR